MAKHYRHPWYTTDDGGVALHLPFEVRIRVRDRRHANRRQGHVSHWHGVLQPARRRATQVTTAPASSCSRTPHRPTSPTPMRLVSTRRSASITTDLSAYEFEEQTDGRADLQSSARIAKSGLSAAFIVTKSSDSLHLHGELLAGPERQLPESTAPATANNAWSSPKRSSPCPTKSARARRVLPRPRGIVLTVEITPQSWTEPKSFACSRPRGSALD